jgi:hypothetical protein
MTKQQLRAEIDAYMQKFGRPKRDWYFGIATDVEQRLFGEHNVQRGGTWIHGLADTAHLAMEIEYVYQAEGCQGGPGGADDTTKYVYAYLITPATVE